MAKPKKVSFTRKIFIVIGILIAAFLGIWGYNTYMEKQKVDNLYKHGFQLLEEQIATYIVEHYSGISKVEFSPIFMSGGGSQSFLKLDVVPVVYDNYGNRALLAGETNEGNFAAFGYPGELYDLEVDEFGDEIIVLKHSSKDDWIDVSNAETLPEEAKLSGHARIDMIVSVVIKENKVKGISKSKQGSPKAKLTYNLDIQKGEWRKWH